MFYVIQFILFVDFLVLFYHTVHDFKFFRTKKRVIGTLDVAFKKRFFALSGGGADPAGEGKSARKLLRSLKPET